MLEKNKGTAGDWTVYYMLVPSGEKNCVSLFGMNSLQNAIQEAVASITALEVFDPSVKVEYEIVAAIREGVDLKEYYDGGPEDR